MHYIVRTKRNDSCLKKLSPKKSILSLDMTLPHEVIKNYKSDPMRRRLLCQILFVCRITMLREPTGVVKTKFVIILA